MRRSEYPWLIIAIVTVALLLLFWASQQPVASGAAKRSRALTGSQEQIAGLEALYQTALASGEREVVVYQAAMDFEWQPIWQAFSEAFPGLKVTYMHVSPAEAAQRLDSETVTQAHYADLISFPINNIFDLKAKDYLSAYTPVTIDGLAHYYQTADHKVHFSFLKVFGLGYSKTRLANQALPQNIQQLLSAQWVGQFEYGQPSLGAGTADLAFVRLLETHKISQQDLYRLKNNGGTAGTQEYGIILLAQAKTVFNPWAYLPPLVRQKQLGVPIDIAYIPDFTLLVPFGQGLVKHPAHPYAAKLLLSWLFTPDVQQLLAEKSLSYSTMPNAPKPQGLARDINNQIHDPRFYPEAWAAKAKQWAPVIQDIWLKK
jgi:iron(III) transport system substrate-binding protein